MSDKGIKILDAVVRFEGKCDGLDICYNCPLKPGCFSSAIKTGKFPSSLNRKQGALDLLANFFLLGDEPTK